LIYAFVMSDGIFSWCCFRSIEFMRYKISILLSISCSLLQASMSCGIISCWWYVAFIFFFSLIRLCDHKYINRLKGDHELFVSI
jgi:hypothetical protein